MSFPYKHVLLVGATAGIGRAMAERLVLGGAKVTAVGRRKDRLDELVSKHGEAKVNAEPFDIGNLDEIPAFAAECVVFLLPSRFPFELADSEAVSSSCSIMAKYPDVDSLFLNAGIQAKYDLANPAEFDLSVFENEMKVNFGSFVSLVHAFLPYFLKKDAPRSIIL